MKALKDKVVVGLINELLNEPFARSRDFSKKDLDSVCSEIESEGYLYSTTDSLGAEFDSEKLSFEKAKDLVCLILIQLDLSGETEMPPGPLQRFLSIDFDPNRFSCPFLAAAEYLKHLKASEQLPVEPTLTDKMIVQNFCLSFESQLAKNLEEPLKQLWTIRDQVVRQCVTNSGKKIELSDEWTEKLDQALELEAISFSRAERSKLFLETFRLIATSGAEPRLCFSLLQMGALVLLLSLRTPYLPLSGITAGKLAGLVFQFEQKKQRAQSLILDNPVNWLDETEALLNAAKEFFEEMRSLPQIVNEAA